jgi:hypothetical protein
VRRAADGTLAYYLARHASPIALPVLVANEPPPQAVKLEVITNR